MNDTETVGETLTNGMADTLQHWANELRGADSETVKRIAEELAEYSRGYMRTAAFKIQESEYYVCPLCETDFHTERERNGNDCRYWNTRD